jgi:hypothetical protein
LGVIRDNSGGGAAFGFFMRVQSRAMLAFTVIKLIRMPKLGAIIYKVRGVANLSYRDFMPVL